MGQKKVSLESSLVEHALLLLPGPQTGPMEDRFQQATSSGPGPF